LRYSQNDEERRIVDLFHSFPPGRLLDIGAFDGITFSNTRRLLELGWQGVLVEPSLTIMPDLLANVRQFDGQVTIVPVAIGETAGDVTFYDANGEGVSTTSVQHVAKWSDHVRYFETKTPQITPVMLLDKVGRNFDFVSIDVESTNAAVCRDIPWGDLTHCRVICIEHDEADDKINETLKPFGFSVVHRNAENLIFSRSL
jgi:FkbM family methyltransferase